VTCGITEFVDAEGNNIASGNTDPSNLLGGGDLVPSSDVAIMRLTVYI